MFLKNFLYNTNSKFILNHLKNNKNIFNNNSKCSNLFFSSSKCLKQEEGLNPALTTLNEEEKLLVDSVSKFAAEKIEPFVEQMDKQSKMEDHIIKDCFEAGLMGLDIPEKYGGSDGSFMSSILTIEELAKVDGSVSVMVDVQNTLFNNAIQNWGNPDQKQQYLPRLATDTLASFCLSEWSCGSDAFALKTRATKLNDDSNYYNLNGTKAWITNAGEADLFLVFATIDQSLAHKGITAFLVEKNNDGLSIGKREDKLGIKASSTCEVILEDCKVHKDAIVGEIGKGYQIAIGTLNEGRIGIAAQMLGIAEGAYEKTMPYLADRKAFGSRLIDFQLMQHQYAECALQIEAAKLMVYNAARLKQNDQPFIQAASMAKLYASQVAEKVSSTCVNMLGGVGFTREFGVEKYFRDCKIGQIYEGTSNIQYQTIAKEISKHY